MSDTKRYFLGSVGKAEAFRMKSNGELELAFVSKTLTDSGLNIQTTKDDIRAGQGAPIQFSFYHDPSVEITLTDVLWKPQYLTAQLGAEFDDQNGHDDYVSETVTLGADGVSKAELATTPKALPIACAETEQVVVWGAKVGTEDWKVMDYDSSTGKVSLPVETGVAGDYCVRYLGNDDRAKVAKIYTLIVPEILLLIITAPIFAGDACSSSKGKPVGHITFEIPKFQLNGSQEFSMNMSSNQTMSLSGIALASPSTSCDAGGDELLKIIEVIDNRDWKADIEDIMSDEEYEKVGLVPHIYGIKKDGTVTKLENTDLTFNPGLSNKVFASTGETTITLTGTDPAVTTTVNVAAGE